MFILFIVEIFAFTHVHLQVGFWIHRGMFIIVTSLLVLGTISGHTFDQWPSRFKRYFLEKLSADNLFENIVPLINIQRILYFL